jgi:hypothetical protein
MIPRRKQIHTTIRADVYDKLKKIPDETDMSIGQYIDYIVDTDMSSSKVLYGIDDDNRKWILHKAHELNRKPGEIINNLINTRFTNGDELKEVVLDKVIEHVISEYYMNVR